MWQYGLCRFNTTIQQPQLSDEARSCWHPCGAKRLRRDASLPYLDAALERNPNARNLLWISRFVAGRPTELWARVAQYRFPSRM